MKYVLFIFFILSVSCGRTHIESTRLSGKPGLPGKNSLVKTTPFTDSPDICQSSAGVIVQSGLDINNSGFLEQNEIQSTAIVCNGTNGTNGVNGTNGTNGINGTNGSSSVVEIIHPCANIPGAFPEVFFRMQDRSIIAFFTDGTNFRLSQLSPGNYSTSDGRNCNLYVDSNYNITYY